jgi:hypothetical protein
MSNPRYKNNSRKVQGNFFKPASKPSLAKVLIEFLNKQDLAVHDLLVNAIYQGYLKNTYTPASSSINVSKNSPYFYVSDAIDSGHLTIYLFLNKMREIKKEMRENNLSFVGFGDVSGNYRSLPQNSDERKEMKYKGMINCCIINDNCDDPDKLKGSVSFGSFSFKNPFAASPPISTCSWRPSTAAGGTRKRRNYKKKSHRRRR